MKRRENQACIATVSLRLSTAQTHRRDRGARLSIAIHIVKAILNHGSGSIIGVATIFNRYDYAKRKREALAASAKYVD